MWGKALIAVEREKLAQSSRFAQSDFRDWSMNELFQIEIMCDASIFDDRFAHHKNHPPVFPHPGVFVLVVDGQRPNLPRASIQPCDIYAALSEPACWPY